MKIKQYIFALLLAVPALWLQSCKNTIEDKFDTSASVRQEAFIDQFRQKLLDSEYGWVMDYYPQSNQSIGGYVFCLKFTEDEVTATCEKDPSLTVTSYYSLKNNIGPSLSFDTYNKVLHNYFCEGSPDGYQAQKGDFEFRLDSIVGDKIYMHGNRNNNVITLHKLTYDPNEYLAKAIDIRDFFLVDKIKGSINGEDINGDFTWSTRQIALTYGSKSRDMAYVFTDKGIRFYKEITVGGVPVYDLQYDSESKTFIIPDGNGGTISLEAPNPEWLDKYYAWQGEWVLTCHTAKEADSPTKELDVTLVPTKGFETYLMRGLNPNYDVVLEYRKADDSFYWTFQTLTYIDDVYNVRMLPYSAQGYVGTSTTYGMVGEWNEEQQALVWREKGNWTRVCSGFTLNLYENATRIGGLSPTTYPDYVIDGSAYLYGVTSLKRK